VNNTRRKIPVAPIAALENSMSKPFKGVIDLDVRDSTPDWGPYQPPIAREGSPNVLFVVMDDTGIAAWDTFGGQIEMPTLNRIAKLGVRYSQFHTTALCSPTRSCFLTGRNAHNNSMACITEGANGFPGRSALIPRENGTFAETLVEQGYSTYCVGKWHLSPSTEITPAGSRRTWPLGRGFEHFYGFLGGETNQWYPDLVRDNDTIEPPYGPEQGYHLSKDLVDQALRYIRDSSQADPDKPWCMYLAFGANHAPHHVWKEWADRYKGKFDQGYEKYRETTLVNMKKLGIVPQNTELSAINPWPAPEVIDPNDLVKPWDTLSDDEKRLFARMAEVYAGFSSYTDDQLGRLIDYLESSGQLDNTLIIVVSDNGASGEGGPTGSVNENKFFNGVPDDLKANLAQIDELGSPHTYNHYPTGWAVAFSTPYKMFKRYSLEGGVADPLIIAWPKETKKDGGQVRDQYHHAIDLVPTIYDCCGIAAPETIKGYTQTPIQGVTMRYSFANADAPTTRAMQYYEMLGTRALYHNGWKVVARHGAISGVGHFMQDQWELYNVEKDRSEVHDLAADQPQKVQELVGAWFALAGRNNVFPLDDRTAVEQLNTERPTAGKPRTTFTYYPHTSGVPESVSANIRNKSFAFVADLHVDTPEVSGVIFSAGSQFGGHVLYVADGKAHYAYNFLGMKTTEVAGSEALPTGDVSVGVEFTKTSENPKFVANGSVKLSVNGKVVAETTLTTQPGSFGLSGSALTIGRSGDDPVLSSITAPAAFTGGTIKRVVANISGEHVADLEREAAAALARE
jgi:arylsulfatase A-like enzyme